MKEIDDIKQALAAGPTPGPWDARCYKKACHFDDKEADGYVIGGATYEADYENPMLCKSDDQFIAACNPAAMQAVLAHIEAQAVEIAAYDVAIAEYRQQCIDNHAEIERLRAESDERLKNTVAQAMEIERLRPDAERYRHIRSKKSRDHNHHSKRALEAGICDWSRSLDQNSTCSFWSTADLTEEALDEAVDASIKEKP